MSVEHSYIWRRYIYDAIESVEVRAPTGYRLHSWKESWDNNNQRTVFVCWEKIPTSSAIIPAEYIGPALEWMRRWVARNT